MKLFKLVPIVSIALLPIASFPVASCSNTKELTEQEQYISNRTFSILARDGTYACAGTGWIISDATKQDANDYCYWMATNWHVIHGFDIYLSGNITYKYADSSVANMNGIIPYNNYVNFSKFEIEDKSKFVYEDPESTQFFIPCIDLYVVKVDFGNPTGAIKTKLDNLNKFQVEHNYINKFASDNADTRLKNKAIGGYPKKGSRTDGGKWEAHTITASGLDYKAKGQTKRLKDSEGNVNIGHSIGEPVVDQFGVDWSTDADAEYFFYWDISPQYASKNGEASDYMSNGASGSMLLTEDYEVCGIYWGGWTSGSGSSKKYYPGYSIFNSTDINFLKPYI